MHPPAGSLPGTDDERWRELLMQMAVPTLPGVYVLGCFARHVTFYSQQVRALNLIDALCNTGRLREGSTLGVVGAGLAGLTCAAAALARGLDVNLFEKSADPGQAPGRMPLQINSDERWVDPFVYDWPLDSVGAGESSAQLPLLDWSAQTASQVRATVLGGFESLLQQVRRQRGRDGIAFHECEVREDMLARGADLRLRLDTGAQVLPLDVLILALGFGVEDAGQTRSRYWTNDGLGGSQSDHKRFLVSGMGDGGLTEVMRLTIADFRHRDVLAAFRDSAAVGDTLQAAVREGGDELWTVFLAEASKLRVADDDRRQRLARRKTQVYLAGSPQRLFGPEGTASILNRLIVAWLFLDGRFAFVDARVRTPVRSDGGRCVADYLSWQGDEAVAAPPLWVARDGRPVAAGEALPADFDEAVIRHGPGRAGGASQRPVQQYFPTFWDDSEDARDYWRSRPHWDDWTRQPHWEPGAFGADAQPLDSPAGGGRLFAVVEHPVTNGLVTRAVRTAMQLMHKGAAAGEPRPSLVALDAVADCDGPQRFGRAVRTLCRADVAVFDLSDVEQRAETLVLLGIRAVARRGVTLISARFTDPQHEPHEADAGFAVPLMPFLLQDAAVYGWGEEEKFTVRLKKGIEEGLHRARRLGPIYRDLPAYDEVRRLGPEAEDHRPQGPDDAVLFLSSFDADHRRTRGSWLRSRVRAAAEGRGIYIIESASPERTSSKLYGAIRRTQLCIVDWTKRRPNVFFEFGVRLAASPQPAICVIHRGDPWAAAGEGGESGLPALFRPLVYDDEAKAQAVDAFQDELVRRRAALDGAQAAAAWPRNGARLSPDFVYREVCGATPLDSQDWAVPVWGELNSSAQQMVGSNPVKYPDPPVLFNDHADYRRRARQNAADRLLAAWYFLDRRHGLQRRLGEGGRPDFDAETTRAWIAIGNTILGLLEYDPREDYIDMRQEIDRALRQASALRRQESR